MTDYFMADKEKGKEYFRKVGKFTLNSYMERFNESEYTANKYLWEMVDEGILQQEAGFLFRYVPQPGDEEEVKEEEEAGKSLYDELFGGKSETKNAENEADKAAEAFEDYKSRTANKTIEEIELEDDEDDLEDLFEDELDDELDNFRYAKDKYHEARRKQMALDKVARHLDGIPLFDKRRCACIGSLGLTYPDDSPIKVRITYDERIRMSDMGGTMGYMSRYFNVENTLIAEGIKQVLGDYSLTMDEETQEISMNIQDAENAKISFMCFFAAIERIVNLQSLNLARIVTDEVEERSKEEMKKILFNKELDFHQAKEHVDELLAQAKESGTDEDKIVFENIAWLFGVIKEDSYEQFVESIFWDEG